MVARVVESIVDWPGGLLCTVGLFIGIQHATNSGGLVGVLALGGAVPAATILHGRLVWEYPLVFHSYLLARHEVGSPTGCLGILCFVFLLAYG